VRRTFLLAGVFMAGSLAAQAPALPDTAARRMAMDSLGFLVGDWGGEAWVLTPSGRQRIWQTETVRRKLGGQVLLIEGLGRLLTEDGPADTVFQALAVVQWTPEDGYRMRSTTREGRSGEFDLELTSDGFVWGIAVPSGRVQYTMTRTPDGEWLERGVFVRDGAPPVPMIEMRLRRTNP